MRLTFFYARWHQAEEVLSCGDADVARVLAARVADDAPRAADLLREVVSDPPEIPDRFFTVGEVEGDPRLHSRLERWYGGVTILLRWHGQYTPTPGEDLDELVQVAEDQGLEEGAEGLRRLLWGRHWGTDEGGTEGLLGDSLTPAVGYALEEEIPALVETLDDIHESAEGPWVAEAAMGLRRVLLDALAADRDVFCVLRSPFPDPL